MIPRLRSPGFWWTPRSRLATLLAPAGAIYGRAAGHRMRRAPGYRAAVPVVAIGNFVAGGAGKTPVALAVAGLLDGAGRKPGFLSRGYGGTARGPVTVDPERHAAREIGDEPLLLAAAATTVVAADRIAGARLLEAGAVDCIVLDDGFQNPALAKDLSIVVVDAATGVGNARCLPAGPLRAPLEEQLRHVGLVVVMGQGRGADRVLEACARAGTVVHRAALDIHFDAALRNHDLLAWCAIGRPEKFFLALEHAGLRVARRMPFADHLEVSEAEAGRLLSLAEAEGLVPVTTAKDEARMRHTPGKAQARLHRQSRVIGAQCVFADPGDLAQRLNGLFLPPVR